MKLKKITEDYSVVEKDAPAGDLIERVVSRALRNRRRGGPPIPKKIMTIEERSEALRRSQLKQSKKAKAVRRECRRKGLCTNCKRERDPEFYLCNNCRYRWRVYNQRARIRRSIEVEYGH